MADDEEKLLHPNAFVSEDPKQILIGLFEYATQKQMKCQYKKNANKMKLFVPISEERLVEFQVIFEKGRKKHTKGLYRLRFEIEEGFSEHSDDQEFICTGFLNLIKDLAQNCANPL